jgi:putative transposase
MSTTQTKSTRTIKKLPVFDDDRDLSLYLERSLTDNLKHFIRHSVTTLVKAEMEQLRTELQQASGSMPSFNGYYTRHLTSPFGRVESIPIPRFREGFGADGELMPTTLDGFANEQARTWKLLHDMHQMGVSQRKVKLLAKQHLGLTMSAKRLKDVSQELVMHESAQINLKPLTDEYQYLFLDGIWEKVKGHGWDNTAAVVLCVLGMKRDGARELIGFTLTRAEDADSWTKLLKDMKARGLSGSNLELVIMDDSAGCKLAIERVFGAVPIQNCIVHKLRSVLAHTSHQHKAAIAEDLKVITTASSPDEAVDAAKAIAKKWYQKEARAIASLRHNFEYCVTYYQFPRETWKTIRSTNILEREFREVRRRTKVNDHSFHNFESARRYHEGMFQYLNQHYPAR